VAYAIGRPLGNAAQRNRARRRLREAVREASAGLEPGRAYLFGAGREAVTMPYREVVATVEQLLRRAREAG
jgi:ribonuclease P protein component